MTDTRCMAAHSGAAVKRANAHESVEWPAGQERAGLGPAIRSQEAMAAPEFVQ